MRLFLQQYYQLTKANTPESIIEKIEQVLEVVPRYQDQNYIYINDSSYSSRSKVELAMRRFPELKPYYFIAKEYVGVDEREYNALSNLGNHWAEQNPNGNTESVSFHPIKEIVKGIPRTYPFHKSMFIFDQINWFNDLKTCIDPIGNKLSIYGPTQYLSNCIMYVNNWWINRRETYLIASFELPLPDENCPSLEKALENDQEVLNLLGKPRSKQFFAIPTDDEKFRLIKLKEDLATIQYPTDLEKELILKEDLFELTSAQDDFGEFNVGSRKKELLANFKPMKYTYLSSLSGQGTYYLVKQTKNNNQIKLMFDSGKFGNTLYCYAHFQTPFEDILFDVVPLYTPTKDLLDFPISNEDTLAKVVHNFSKTIKIWEQTRLAMLDELYGKAPKWFQYQ